MSIIFSDEPYIHPIQVLEGCMHKMSIDDAIIESESESDSENPDTGEEKYDEYGDIIPDYKYAIISIDVGITNLGFSLNLVDEAFHLIQVAWVKLIDITQYTHEYDLHDKECHIDHSSRQIADWLAHIFLEYETLFEKCDYILVEKQPPQGLVVIEQILLFKYRYKTHLIHPRSMHSHFQIGISNISGDNAYELRKMKTQIIAEKNCVWHQRAIKSYKTVSRKHDITDSICLLLFWLFGQNKEYTRKMNHERIQNQKLPNLGGISALDWLESFRYVKY